MLVCSQYIYSTVTPVQLGVAELAITVLTVLAIIISGFYGFLAWSLNRQTKIDTKRIDDIESFLDDQKDEIFGVRVVGEILLTHLNNNIGTLRITTKVLEKLIRDKNTDYDVAEIDRLLLLFRAQQEKHETDIGRVILYTSIISGPDSVIADQLHLIETKFPDRKTAEFLDCISAIRNDESSNLISQCATRIRKECEGPYSSSSWTGRYI